VFRLHTLPLPVIVIGGAGVVRGVKVTHKVTADVRTAVIRQAQLVNRVPVQFSSVVSHGVFFLFTGGGVIPFPHPYNAPLWRMVKGVL